VPADFPGNAEKTEGIVFEANSGWNHPELAEWRICSEDGTRGETKAEVRIFERSIISGSASAKSTKSLFDKLGRTKSIEAVVDEFYKRVLADTELNPSSQDQYDVATDAAGPIFHPSSGRSSAL